MLPDFVLGLDLGQASDWTALALLETVPSLAEPTYALLHLDRWRGESYLVVPGRMHRVLDVLHGQWATRRLLAQARGEYGLAEKPRIALLVDRTGVGRAVVDHLHGAGLKPIGVTIHGGDLVTEASHDDFRVPKRDLAAVVAVLLQQRRLRIARALPLADTLTSELGNFRVTISASGHDRYGAGGDGLSWREQPHDDLVLAVALAGWYAEYQRQDGNSRLVRVGSYLPSGNRGSARGVK